MSENNKSSYDDLSDYQLDALREIGNIGAGNAAIALTEFLNRSTYMSIPRVKVDNTTNLVNVVKMPKGKEIAIVSLDTIQDLRYGLFAFFNDESVQRIIDLMTTDYDTGDPADIVEMSPLFLSLIKEIGSILLLKYVEALNKLLKVGSYPSPPVLRIGTVESIVDHELKDLKISKVLFIQCDVFTSEKKIQVDIAIIPYQEDFDSFMTALEHGIED
jgi:chemotaxis protein CheC